MKRILLMADAPSGGGGDSKAKLVKIRIRKLVDEVDKKTGKPNGKTRNTAQPIVLAPGWKKEIKGLKLPDRLEVNETYEVPELLAKSLLPDVEIVN